MSPQLNAVWFLYLTINFGAGNTEGSTELSKSVAAVADLEKKWRAMPIYTSEWGRYASALPHEHNCFVCMF